MARGSLQGSHPVFRKALSLAEGVAPLAAPLLIFGERGTGRETFARHIHGWHSPEARELVKVDCAAAGAAAEVEARLSALQQRRGGAPPELGGTLLLKEVGDLSADGQQALTTLIAPAAECSPWRVIAASSRDLATEARHGKFRADLYHAFSRIVLYLPPLNQRRSDVPELVRYFLERAAGPGGPPGRISDGALVALWQYDWPGNVAELKTVVTRLVETRLGGVIHTADLPVHIRACIEGSASSGGASTPHLRFRAAS